MAAPPSPRPTPSPRGASSPGASSPRAGSPVVSAPPAQDSSGGTTASDIVTPAVAPPPKIMSVAMSHPWDPPRPSEEEEQRRFVLPVVHAVTSRPVVGVRLGLDWSSERAIDLDAYAIMFDSEGQLLETVYFDNTVAELGGIVHEGDNRTGRSKAGDDESINVIFDQVPEEVSVIMIMVNSFSGETFAEIGRCACRLYARTDESADRAAAEAAVAAAAAAAAAQAGDDNASDSGSSSAASLRQGRVKQASMLRSGSMASGSAANSPRGSGSGYEEYDGSDSTPTKRSASAPLPVPATAYVPGPLLKVLELDVPCESDSTTVVLGLLYRRPYRPPAPPVVAEAPATTDEAAPGTEGTGDSVANAAAGEGEVAKPRSAEGTPPPMAPPTVAIEDGDSEYENESERSRSDAAPASGEYEYDEEGGGGSGVSGETAATVDEGPLTWFFHAVAMSAIGDSVDDCLPQLRSAMRCVLPSMPPFMPEFMVTAPPQAVVELTPEVVSPALSLLTKGIDGLSHCLSRLQLTGGAFTTIAALSGYPGLRYVALPRNAIADLGALSALNEVMTLDLRNNRIVESWGAVPPRRWLEKADLSHNRIRALSQHVHPRLAFLSMANNCIERITGLETATALSTLVLNHNFVASLRGVVAPHLRELHLSHNRVRSLGRCELPSLTVLNLDNNSVTLLRDFDRLTALTTLSLRNNKVHARAEVARLAALPALLALRMDGCPVSDASEADWRLEALLLLPRLADLDSEPVAREERAEIEEVRAERAAAAERGEEYDSTASPRGPAEAGGADEDEGELAMEGDDE